MDLDLINSPLDTSDITPREIEEALADPFGLRMIPDDDENRPNRYYLLGKTISNRSLFIVFKTDGKNARIITAREQSENETAFYERKYAELL